MSYALMGAAVLPAAESPLVEGVDVVMAGDRIVAVGKDAHRGFPEAQRVDASGTLVVPGFVNAHTHSCESLRRGLAVDASLEGWLDEVWRGLDQLSEETIYLAVTLSAIEMLKGGTTAVLDHFRQRPMRREALTAAKRAYEEIGLRATIAVMLRDDDGPGASTPAQALDDQLAICEEHLGAAGFVSFAVGPSGPTRCSDDLLVRANRLALAHGAVLQMHLDETLDQARAARERYGGLSSTQRLADLGVLGAHISCAHGVWLTPEDIAILAATRTRVVHNPVSNMRLGSGRAPVAALLRAGVEVALGTDGAASNDGLDVLESAKTAVLLSRLGPPHEWLGPRETLRMALHAGRSVLGESASAIVPGAFADLAVIDLNAPAFVPLHDAATQLVLSGRSTRVRHTFVAGKWVVRDGALADVDERSLYEEARSMLIGAAA